MLNVECYRLVLASIVVYFDGCLDQLYRLLTGERGFLPCYAKAFRRLSHAAAMDEFERP